MAEQPVPSIRFGSSWSTQIRLTQGIGKGLSEPMRVRATVVIGERGMAGLENGDVDVLFSKSVNNEHLATGRGLYARAEPVGWLRSIAWLPQDDVFLFAVSPESGIASFEDIAERRPKLHVASGMAEVVLKAYGFSYDDIRSWGGTVRPMEHTAAAAQTRFDEGALDACFGDGSAFDGSCWTWLGEHGYRFLDVSEAAMQRLEAQGLRRHTVPAGFLPGINRNLLALDDSHIVFTCHQRLDDELAYNLAKAIDTRKREIEAESIQVALNPDGTQSQWTSLTGPIDHQWDQRILGAPLHPGAERYYREKGVL